MDYVLLVSILAGLISTASVAILVFMLPREAPTHAMAWCANGAFLRIDQCVP